MAVPAAWGLVLALCFTLPVELNAHRLNNSRTSVRVNEDSLRLELAVDESDLAVAFPLDRNGDGVLWRNEMVAGIPEVAEYVVSRLQVRADGIPLDLVRQAVYIDPDNQGNLYLNLRFAAALGEPPAILELRLDLFERFSEGHKNLTAVTAYGGEPQPAVFSDAVRDHRFVLREDPVVDPSTVIAAGGVLLVAGLILLNLRRRRTATSGPAS